MRVVIQRSLQSFVKVENQIVGEISKGLVLLICMEKGDGVSQIEKAAQKILNLRCFEDQGKMSHNILQIEGQILAISQFTLSWRGQKGNRPGFENSMAPEEANQLFERLCDLLSKNVKVSRGLFGASMKVEITNDGPVTFCLDF